MFFVEKFRNSIFLALTLLALTIGIMHASSLWFVNDDCFISFRYAKNLINGLGLVYNAGEHVEAFTNFLWTVIVAGGMKLGFDPVPFSTVLGILFFSSNLILFAFLSYTFSTVKLRALRATLTPDDNQPAHSPLEGLLFALPLTSLGLCLHRDVAAYATGGLETSMYTFLVSSGFALLLFSKSSKHVVLAGTVFVLAMMTRPDGVLFVFASCIYIVLTKEKILKNLIILLLPSVVIFLPYWLWRYSYYGLFFPNSFYAKSGDLAYYSQGMTYTILYFKTYYGFIVIPLVAFVSIIRNRKEFLSLSFFQTLRTEHHPIQRVALSLLFIGIYSFFIIRVGGDFMFARFFIPITPILFFLAETLLSQLNKPALTLAISILLLISIVFRYDQFTENDTIGYIADEAHYYSVQSIDRSKEHGLMLAKYFKDSPARIAFWAGQLRMMYYAEPGYALEASAGLTDTALSHLVLNERGRPGHEKTATTDFLLKRKINFFIAPFTVPPKGKPVLNAIIFNGIVARIIIYDTNIMTELEKYPEVRFVNFPRYLDEYITTMSRNPLQQLMADYQFFRSYYFDHNQDPVRQQAIEAYIRSLMQ